MKLKQIAIAIVVEQVSKPGVSEKTGNPYFTLYVRELPFGQTVRRTLFGKFIDEEKTQVKWDRVSPEAANGYRGHDLSGHPSIEAAAIEPERFTGRNGEDVVVECKTFEVFSGEILEQAARRSGSKLRQMAPAQPVGAIAQ